MIIIDKQNPLVKLPVAFFSDNEQFIYGFRDYSFLLSSKYLLDDFAGNSLVDSEGNFYIVLSCVIEDDKPIPDPSVNWILQKLGLCSFFYYTKISLQFVKKVNFEELMIIFQNQICGHQNELDYLKEIEKAKTKDDLIYIFA